MKNDATTPDRSRHATTATGSAPDFSAFVNLNPRAMESWGRSSAGMMKDVAGLAQEIMTFSQSHLQADIDAWKDLAACRNPADLFACQRRFTETATDQYFAEASKIGSRIVDLVGDASALLRQEQASKS